MKNLKKITVGLIVFGLIILFFAIIPHFVSFQKITAFAFLLILLPFLALEFLIPSGILRRNDINDKLPWFGILSYYLIVFPFVNLCFILFLNEIFDFLPEIPSNFPEEAALINKELLGNLIKMVISIYFLLVGSGLFFNGIWKIKK
ncbi:MAG: hypothetical protein PF488_01085 [Patescibacteria group bacterium]|jgi:hypothetical protein|nr:hypothetical protein [Patescibacteria group bacterium]